MAARNLIPSRRRAEAPDDRGGKLHREEPSCTKRYFDLIVFA